MEELHTRLDRLEASLRRTRATLTVVVLAALLALAGGALLATASSDTITARAFHLVDGQGKLRALLAVTPDGPGLALVDEQGELRAGLAVIRGGEGLNLWNAAGGSTFSAP